jgi:hypothetical protein
MGEAIGSWGRRKQERFIFTLGLCSRLEKRVEGVEGDELDQRIKANLTEGMAAPRAPTHKLFFPLFSFLI